MIRLKPKHAVQGGEGGWAIIAAVRGGSNSICHIPMVKANGISAGMKPTEGSSVRIKPPQIQFAGFHYVQSAFKPVLLNSAILLHDNVHFYIYPFSKYAASLHHFSMCSHCLLTIGGEETAIVFFFFFCKETNADMSNKGPVLDSPTMTHLALLFSSPKAHIPSVFERPLLIGRRITKDSGVTRRGQ